MMSGMVRLIETLEHDDSLDEPEGFRRRIEALDQLEFCSVDGEPAQLETPELYERAKVLCDRLEAVNSWLYQGIRGAIQRGEGRDILLPYFSERGADRFSDETVVLEGYDYLDDLLGGVLELEEPAAEAAQLEREMVRYQPTPARYIFDLIRRTELTDQDVLMDFGSGIGHVPLMTAICTGARGIGIELEGAYVNSARRCAEALNLTSVRFEQRDVRTAELAEGTVFYLFTPFTGGILRRVLDQLRVEAASRAIRICTFGPVAVSVAEEGWLEADGMVGTQRISVFRSQPYQ